MNMGAFALVIDGNAKAKSGEIADFAGMHRYAPMTAGLLAMFFLALAGIPPLAGWFAKFVMFRAVLGVFESGWAIALAAIAAVNAVIALYYYARVVKSVYMDEVPIAVPRAEAAAVPTAPSLVLAIAITAAVVIVVGFFPQVLAFFGEAARAFLS
jgi:NADH-quinone oxidoreductase subunit N